MASSYMSVSNEVHIRSSFGRFIRECDEAATETVREAINEGAKHSKRFAPTKTTKLRNSIVPVMLSSRHGVWIADTDYALAQEFGAPRHDIPGNPHLAFFWENMGRRYVPASVYYKTPGMQSIVDHPGHAANPYLRPAYKIVMRNVMQYARKHYPR